MYGEKQWHSQVMYSHAKDNGGPYSPPICWSSWVSIIGNFAFYGLKLKDSFSSLIVVWHKFFTSLRHTMNLFYT